MNSIRPPAVVKGMKRLNRLLFSKEVKVQAVIFDAASHATRIAQLRKQLKPYTLTMRQIKPLQTWENDSKAILLDPDKCTGPDTDTGKDILVKAAPILNCLDYKIGNIPLRLEYDNWTTEEVLRSILPDELSVVSGFTVVGHIAHLNLKDSHLPYKDVIGQVIMDKHKNIETVVNKLDVIDNTYRNFEMEVLAGRKDFNVTVKENNCTYQFDFSQVYWNSRLSTEHERIVKQVQRDTVVYDVFAGVGPFAVPAAKKGALVYANDLNPESYKSLCQNLTKNKVKGECHIYNMDGSEFIRSIVSETLEDHLKQRRHVMVIMNLPALALEFISSFCGLLGDGAKEISVPPTVYCYCFSSKGAHSTLEEDSAQRANAVLQQEDFITPDMCRIVRNVAPNKEMLCIKFPLTCEILSEPTQSHKRLKRNLSLQQNE